MPRLTLGAWGWRNGASLAKPSSIQSARRFPSGACLPDGFPQQLRRMAFTANMVPPQANNSCSERAKWQLKSKISC